jgi:ssDNA-binding Zn-finger/Zn-ribbon topoisomerase 1
MPIDPRELRRSKNAPVDLITTDRLCGRCRYNLKGLPSNGNCPECGRPIAARSGKRTFTDNLADAPMFYLKTLAVGMVLLAVFSVLTTAAFNYLHHERTILLAAIAGGLSVAWWVGVFIVTSQRVRGDNTLFDEVLDSPKWRMVNRLLQLVWPLAAVAWAGAITFAAPIDAAMGYAAIGLEAIGLFALVPLCVHLSALAFWAGDTSVGERLRYIAWFMVVLGVLILVGRFAGPHLGLAGKLFMILAIWSMLGMAAVNLYFLWSLLQLAHAALWAVKNNATAAEVAVRVQARKGDALAYRECAKCGYEMSGLGVFDRCPECGYMEEAVKQSGLLSLRLTREAAELAAAADEVVPLEPEKPAGLKQEIRSRGESISTGREYPKP